MNNLSKRAKKMLALFLAFVLLVTGTTIIPALAEQIDGDTTLGSSELAVDLGDSKDVTLGDSEEPLDSRIQLRVSPTGGQSELYAETSLSLEISAPTGTLTMILPEDMEYTAPENSLNKKNEQDGLVSYNEVARLLTFHLSDEDVSLDELGMEIEQQDGVTITGAMRDVVRINLVPKTEKTYRLTATHAEGYHNFIAFDVKRPILTFGANRAGYVMFDGKDIKNDPTGLPTYQTYGTVNNIVGQAKLLVINAMFGDSSQPTLYKDREIKIELGRGLQLYSAPGLKSIGGVTLWEEDKTETQLQVTQLNTVVTSINFTRNPLKESIANYQPKGGTITYTLTNGTGSVSIPLYVIGEVEYFGGGNLVPVDIPDPLKVTTAYTEIASSERKEEIGTLDKFEVNATTIYLVGNRSNNILNLSPGETGTIPSVYFYQVHANKNLLINEISPYILFPKGIEVVDVKTVNESTLSSANLSFEKEAQANGGTKLIMTAKNILPLQASPVVGFSISVKAALDENGDPILPIGTSVVTPNHAGDAASYPFKTNGTMGQVESMFINIVGPTVEELNPIASSHNIGKYPSDVIVPLGGFRLRNAQKDALLDQRVKLEFKDTKITVRNVRIHSSNQIFNNIVVTTRGGHTKTIETLTGATSQFLRYDDLFGDVGSATDGIDTVTYQLAKINSNEYHGVNGSTQALYAHIAYYGYQSSSLVGGSSYQATISSTTASNATWETSAVKTATTTSNVLADSAPGRTQLNSTTTAGASSYLPGEEIPLSYYFSFDGADDGTNTVMYTKGATLYLRDIPFTSVVPGSIVVKNTRTGETYPLGTPTTGTDSGGGTFTAITIPDAIMSAHNGIEQNSLSLSLKLKSDANSPTIGVQPSDYIFFSIGNRPMNFFRGGGMTQGISAWIANKYDVDGSGNLTKYFVAPRSDAGWIINSKLAFKVGTQARLVQGSVAGEWGTYDPVTDTGKIVLNPTGSADYRLVMSNGEDKAMDKFVAYIPIPKEGEWATTDAALRPNGSYDSMNHIQKAAFGWDTFVDGPLTPSGDFTNYTVEYATTYDMGENPASTTNWKTWGVIGADKDNIRTIRVTANGDVPGNTYSVFQFPIDLTKVANADARAGEENVYSARVYRLSTGNFDTFTISEPVALLLKTGTVTGKIFNDANRDGQSVGDTPYAGGMTVTAYKTGTTDIVEETTSLADGTYGFVGLDKQQNVDIVFTNPDTTATNLRFSTPAPSADNKTATVTGVTPSSVNSENVNAGMITPFVATFVGAGGTPALATINRFAGEELGTLPTVGFTGSTFLGWFDGITKVETTRTLSTDKTFMAKWELINQKVTFNDQGATTPVNPTELNVPYGKSISSATGISMPANPQKTHYSFICWSTNPASTGKDANEFKDTTVVGAPVTGYAVWAPVKYTITFDHNGGATAPQTAQKEVTYNVAVGALPTLPHLDKPGHNFKGWATTQANATAGTNDFLATATLSGDVTVYAVWTANNYNLTFNPNGGLSPAPTAISVTFGKSVTAMGKTLPIIPHLDKPGHNFLGWATTQAKANAGTIDFTVGTAVEGDKEVWAVWGMNQYGLSFNVNGATVPTPQGYSLNFGDSLQTTGKILPTLADEGKQGHSFKGWATTEAKATAGNNDFKVDTSVEATTMVWAVWVIKDYPVHFNANGGTQVVPDGAVTFNKPVGTLPTIPHENKEGYNFLGWATTDNATVPNVDATIIITQETEFWAVWSINNYNVTFRSNGGSTPDPAPISVTYDKSISGMGETISTLPNEDKQGHNFGGWATTNNATISNFSDTTVVKTAREVHAVWSINSYNFSFDANTANPVTNVPEADASVAGMPATTPVVYGKTLAQSGMAILPTPTRDGFDFAGWNTKADGTGAVFTAGTPISNVSTTIYATWTIKSYTVTIYSGDAAVAQPNPNTFTVRYKHTLALEGKALPTLSKTHWTFLGWNNNPVASTGNFDDNTVVTDAVIVHGLWSQSTFTINFDKNAADATEANPNVKLVSKNQAIGTANMPVEPTRYGYDFKGWSTTPTGAVNFTASTPITVDDTVYAIWELKTYTVTFDGQGSDTAPNPQNVVLNHGQKVTDVATVPTVVKTGYDFIGWATTPGATAPNVDPANDSIVDTQTIYAVWQIRSYTITVEHIKYDTLPTTPISTEVETFARNHFDLFNATVKNYDYFTFQATPSTPQIPSVSGDQTLKVYYAQDHYTLSVDGELEIRVNDKYPTFTNNAIPLEELLTLTHAATDNSNTSHTRNLRAKTPRPTITSPDFSNLNFGVVTAGFDQVVTLEAEWPNGDIDTKTVRIKVVDRTAPVVENLEDNRRLIVDVGEGRRPIKTEADLLAFVGAHNINSYDNYDGVLPITITYPDSAGFASIKWNTMSEYAIFINATDSSGNTVRKVALISLWDNKSPGGTTDPGTNKPDPNPNVPTPGGNTGGGTTGTGTGGAGSGSGNGSGSGAVEGTNNMEAPSIHTNPGEVNGSNAINGGTVNGATSNEQGKGKLPSAGGFSLLLLAILGAILILIGVIVKKINKKHNKASL